MKVSLWLAWVVANSVAGAAGGATIPLLGLRGLCLLGLPVGLGQYLVLRSFRRSTWLWIVATGIGSLLAGLLVYPAGIVATALLILIRQGVAGTGTDSAGADETVFWLAVVVVGAVIGTIVGSSQRLLARSAIPADVRWVLVSIVAVMASAAVTSLALLGFVFGPASSTFVVSPSAIATGAVFGVIYGAITGIALARLPRQAVADAG